ncbi:hypothetical protein [Agrobacterium tumefaciens]|uniref:DNA polymerase III alpha subunit finger domain-containing protein n=2 Tax=Pseudomonadota TaxID=1224 RepID=A0A423I9Z7_9PSED|nr:hypothetical protein [Agrobacterium tumefaciens]RON22245.1 hypothetical protein BK661_27900 [Pseudomonas frederiksbergensis]AYM19974.1 hypothetical protein At15955_49890 [Agrobacterium tumefaciens]AYM71277.1 hypothetical protein AtA6_50610 [Agrobacterium tumefaciens]NIB58714.1 hypothetical protein [Agrobacterium tumefaciens]NSZ25643.1 hypothetical protein [Agrobacterium tumefaciens]
MWERDGIIEDIRDHKGRHFDLSTIEQEDATAHAKIRHADMLGSSQTEYWDEMAMLARLNPRTFYDRVVKVAMVLPGSATASTLIVSPR